MVPLHRAHSWKQCSKPRGGDDQKRSDHAESAAQSWPSRQHSAPRVRSAYSQKSAIQREKTRF
jgi:hypothetical protein